MSNQIEIYRSLRIRIQTSNPEDKIISIISNDTKDGKTEAAYNLGSSFAKSGKKVLLVDGNLRHPDLSIKLANDKFIGFDEILKGNGDINNTVISCNIDNLYILPTNKSIEDSTELLENDATYSVFEELRKKFDYIIIDTLSMSEGMDAIILGRISDGSIYVTVENKTEAKMLEEYSIMLEEANIKLIGALMRESS